VKESASHMVAIDESVVKQEEANFNVKEESQSFESP
jgi:hypothetical protein